MTLQGMTLPVEKGPRIYNFYIMMSIGFTLVWCQWSVKISPPAVELLWDFGNYGSLQHTALWGKRLCDERCNFACARSVVEDQKISQYHYQ